MDLALLSVLRDGLLRRSEAHLLTGADVEFSNNGTALLQLRRSKTDQEGEGVALYIGKHAADALIAISPAEELLHLQAPVFGLSPQQSGRRVTAAAKAAALGEGFTGHSSRVGVAKDLVKSDGELPALMTADRWKSAKMPARYTERQAADGELSLGTTANKQSYRPYQLTEGNRFWDQWWEPGPLPWP